MSEMHQNFDDLHPKKIEKAQELKNSETPKKIQEMKPSYTNFILEEEARPEAYKKIRVLLEKLKSDDRYLFDAIRNSYYYLTDYFEWIVNVMGSNTNLKNNFIENAKFFADSCLYNSNDEETAKRQLASETYLIAEGRNLLDALLLEVVDYQESPADDDIIPTIAEMLDGENKDNHFWKNFLLLVAYKDQNDSDFQDNRLKAEKKK